MLAIPHNSNLSNGQTFAATDSYGQKMTASYVATRSRNEPVVEITQTKGSWERSWCIALPVVKQECATSWRSSALH